MRNSGFPLFSFSRDGKIYDFWHSELMLVAAEAGQNQRHVDLIWPLWNLLDLTPEGRGTDWYPSLSYGEKLRPAS